MFFILKESKSGTKARDQFKSRPRMFPQQLAYLSTLNKQGGIVFVTINNLIKLKFIMLLKI